MQYTGRHPSSVLHICEHIFLKLKKNQLITEYGKSCEMIPILMLAGEVKGDLMKEMTVQHLEG